MTFEQLRARNRELTRLFMSRVDTAPNLRDYPSLEAFTTASALFHAETQRIKDEMEGVAQKRSAARLAVLDLVLGSL